MTEDKRNVLRLAKDGEGTMTDEELAEEYADSVIGCGDGYYEWTDVEQAFIAGLNKANEWHYVKDGDLPKEYDKPYLCKVYSHFEVGYFTAYKDQPWHFDEYYLDNEDVIAWKEIVLPKEIE